MFSDPAQGEELGVYIAPVYVNFVDKTYQAGADLEASEFYRMMQASNKWPTTAQLTAADFIKLYTKLADEVDEIVTIVISHHMSATIQSVEMAKEEFSKVPTHIIDSESVSLGLGMMAGDCRFSSRCTGTRCAIRDSSRRKYQTKD